MAEAQAQAQVEEVSQGIENLKLANTNNVTPNNNVGTENHKKNRIQVSNTKKPLFFYVNLAKLDNKICSLQGFKKAKTNKCHCYFIIQDLSIATVVTVAEILKNNGLALEKRILTSTVDMKDETRERPIQKAKVEIILAKADKFDELMAAASEEKELGGEDEH